MECIVETGLIGHYGDVWIGQRENKYYLMLSDYGCDYGVEISEKLALLIKNEFASPKNVGISKSNFREL